MKKFSIPLLLSMLLSVFLFASCNNRTTETERLNEWLDVKYEESLQFSPVRLTMLGRKDLYDQIDDMSEQAEEKRLAWQSATIQELKEQFDYNGLTPEAQVSYDLWIFQYELARDGVEFRRHSYAFDQMRSQHTQLPNFMINLQRS